MKPLLPILLALTLAGCAVIDPGKPSLQKIQGTQIGLSDTPIKWPQKKWWDRYNYPQLDSLVSEAIVKNPSLAAAQARLRMADATVRGARSEERRVGKGGGSTGRA